MPLITEISLPKSSNAFIYDRNNISTPLCLCHMHSHVFLPHLIANITHHSWIQDTDLLIEWEIWGHKEERNIVKYILQIYISFKNKWTILYWFCCTLTWIHHRCTWVPNPEPPSHLPPHIISLGSSQCTSPKHPVSCIDFL